MKTKNVIKLTKAILSNQSSQIFVEGLLISIKNETTVIKVIGENKDWSDHVVHFNIHDVFSMEEQIETLVMRLDELIFHHDRVKRLRKVTNQQA
ncbi:hypothetical protein [uncultured Mediterranean phage uvDeep-CGR2-KM19-C269]|nr:hypothetical protein [uncultured Mediterranean phage uvDeep-CGR2-KM19-C269]